MYDPSLHEALTSEQAELVRKVCRFTETYFEDPRFDASHDFKHVLRVTRLATRILEQEQQLRKDRVYDAQTVILGALLHDVDDKKYAATNGASVKAHAEAELIRLGVSPDEAARVQILIDGVSYSSEKKNPQRVRDLLVAIPELGIVQDADRLDAIGAIGIGRVFSYGAVKAKRGMSDSMVHFDDKLLRLEGMMKTETGRRLAAKYTERLRVFKSWWEEEEAFAG